MLTEKWRLIPAFLHSCGKITGCPGLSRECAAVLEDDEVVCKLWVVRVLLPPVAHPLRKFFCIADCTCRAFAAGHVLSVVSGAAGKFEVDFANRYVEDKAYAQNASSGFALCTSCPHIYIGGSEGYKCTGRTRHHIWIRAPGFCQNPIGKTAHHDPPVLGDVRAVIPKVHCPTPHGPVYFSGRSRLYLLLKFMPGWDHVSGGGRAVY